MLTLDNKKVLIIAPHPDDEIIGCGGLILRYRQVMSDLIIVYVCTDNKREYERVNIEKWLSISKAYVLNAMDGFVSEEVDRLCLELIDIIITEKPHIVLLPFEFDNHCDHISTHQFSWNAIEKSRYWKSKTWHVDVVLEYEVWSFIDKPSLIIDITSQIDQKCELMRYYDSQLSFDYLRLIEYKNGYRGLLHNRKGYAEVFIMRGI